MEIVQPQNNNTEVVTIGEAVVGGTDGSVLFVHPTGILAQDNNNFYFQDSPTTPNQLSTNTNVALSINTNGDFTGSNAINIYSQYDAYLPESAITNSLVGLNTDGAVPGFTSSSSRGTGSIPIQLQTGDMTGGFFGFGSQGASSPTYQNLGGMGIFTTGSSTNNLGGELKWYTKGDGGSLVQNMTLTNQGFLGIGSGFINTNINSLLTVDVENLGAILATPAQGIILQNMTAAVVGVQQGSPALSFSSFGWGTTAGTSQSVIYRITMLPVQSTVPTGNLTIGASVAGGAYVTALSLSTAGLLTIPQIVVSSTNGNFLTPSGTGGVNETVAQFLFGGATGVVMRNGFYGNVSTVITVGSAYAQTVFGTAPITKAASGNHPWLAQVVFNGIGVIGAGSATIGNTATVYIAGAASPTVTGNNYSLYVNSGLTLLQGLSINVGSDATGDLNYRASTGFLTRLGIGSTGQTLGISGGLPVWQTGAGLGSYTHTIFTPTTGQTVSLVNNQYNIINPAGALLALTVNLPSSPANNDVVYIKFTQTISTVTYANGTVVDGITAPTAGGLTVLTYDSGTTSWY